MDTFFQKLRDIQKKERTTGTLSEVDDSFYTDASNYLQKLLKMVNNNPLSLEAYQLRDAQRITTEICERREFKIVSTAATNVQKGHDIFKGHKKDSDLYDVIPYNTTPEEEEFYRKIVDMLVDHREHLMDKIILNRSNETKIGFKPTERKVEEKPAVEEEPVVEEVPSKEEVEPEDTISTPSDDVAEPEINENKKTSKPKAPLLDESQIAMMFGQAPDDILLDENNNPVKPVKRDITTPFKGPKPPEEDTVSLQNEPKPEDNLENIVEEVSEEKNNTELESEVTVETTFNTEELVEFKKDIPTDILDENEKTYGPFSVDDIVLLPESIVKILSDNDVINVIK
ncbi:hypothetical protein PXD04_03415 [Methanosphaera sp. ISO3-F5]|uniref:DNA replication complex subunit Gins51 n=1 Tax=Methanosphaera sp. ISO3-F5 TaxID=1452353 RepID=UPI002B256A7A|nr:hypothetical protein [Methanosphaera sp. ISO3-F5]WQH64847.1 hypothetical protein PXD04_03415 [Methanosphaera sp. ISO3-F5]